VPLAAYSRRLVSAVHDRAEDLPEGFAAAGLPVRRSPSKVLMVSPEAFDVVEVLNAHMEGQVGRVDREVATAEWQSLHDLLAREMPDGVAVIPPRPGLADMVFAQNQVVLGRDPEGNRVCVASHFRHESRQPEVEPACEFFASQGYRVVDPVPQGLCLEGGGDATWHPGRQLLWGGYGPRTDAAAYPHVAEALGVPVLRLELVDPRFYHLDTCFRPLDESTVLIYPEAFTPEGQALIAAVFPSVVPVQEADAAECFALNGLPLPGRKYVLHKGAAHTCIFLRALGYSVSELNLGEFLRSGGSAYCLVKFFEPA
jgi:N-dimethylarginine dimethylaminohydrolase